MDSISKEHVISGIIGGVTTLALAMLFKKATCKKGKGACPRVQGGIVTMESDRMPPAIGPYCKGKYIQYPDGSRLAYSSG